MVDATNASTLGPLAGIRVVELATMIAGPLATSILADQGADVIKIEAPAGGDPLRAMGRTRGGMSAVFSVVNRSKRSVAIDVRDARGRDLVRALARTADVFVQNLRPGTTDAFGLGAETLRRENPALITVSISGFGTAGPYAGSPAYDIVIQGMAGLAAIQSDRATATPALVRTVVCDKVAALHAAQAISAALFARARGAGGQHIELSLLDATVAFLWPDGMEAETFLGDGVRAAASMWGLVGVHPTRDGHVTVLAVTDEQFRGLCAALGLVDLAADPRFRTLDDRTRHASELTALVRAPIAASTTTDLCQRFLRHGVPAGPVLAPHELADDPQVRAAELLVELDHAPVGLLRMPRAPSRFGGTPVTSPRPAPALGEHTGEVLAEVGIPAAAPAGRATDEFNR